MTKRMFVYELPFKVRKTLCRILDATDKWEELGGEYMGFDYMYLRCIRRKDSPTDELLTSWGNQNHTVNELFILLSKMQHYRAMTILKDIVHERYHHLLREGEECMTLSIPDKSATELSVSRTNHGHNIHNGFMNSSDAPSAPMQNNNDLQVVQNLDKIPQKSGQKSKVTGNENKIQNILSTRSDNISNRQANPTHNPNLVVRTNSQNTRQERKPSFSGVEATIPEVDYEDLEAATNSWDTTCILGRGGFGTVYKGTWKNTCVAIKKLESERDAQSTAQVNSVQATQSMRELKYLNSHRHDNILSIYGYCIKENVSCLVYQYMANGSLEDRLHRRKNTRPLNWAQRLNIMTGTARGIQFLHSLGDKPLVHGDIKSANILLDNSFEPRLGDFGLAREGPHQQYTHVQVSRVHGTRPYLPDEFLRGKQFSVKVDTYSFGVVLFEVATGLRAYDESRKEKFLKDHIVLYQLELSSLADPLAGPDMCSSAGGLLTVGRNCVATWPKGRPDMKAVLNDVETLYTTYKSAERTMSLAQKGRLSPSSPLDMQAVYDTQSPQQTNHLLPFYFPDPRSQPSRNSPTPPIIQRKMVYQRVLSPEPPNLPKAIRVMHIQGRSVSPQPVMIPTSPPALTIQPPSAIHEQLPSPPQENNIPNAPTSMNSDNFPIVTLLGMKPDPTEKEKLVSKLAPTAITATEETSSDSDSIQSNPVTHIESLIPATVNSKEKERGSSNKLQLSDQGSSFPISLPDANQSMCMPMLSDLLSNKS